MQKYLIILLSSITCLEAMNGQQPAQPMPAKKIVKQTSAMPARPAEVMPDVWQAPKKKQKTDPQVIERSCNEMADEAGKTGAEIAKSLTAINDAAHSILQDKANVECGEKVLEEALKNLNEITTNDHPMADYAKKIGHEAKQKHTMTRKEIQAALKEIQNSIQELSLRVTNVSHKASDDAKDAKSHRENFTKTASRLATDIANAAN